MNKPPISFFTHFFLLLALFLGTFLVYLHNLSFSVYGGDSGDFLSAIAVKGVPHPSGYPLYTLLGILMSYLPFNQPLAWKVGLLSCLFTSLAVVTMYQLVFEFLKSRLLSLITALSYAFVFPFFLFAEFPEVFPLHFLLLLLQFYLAYLYWKKNSVIYLCSLMFSIGLGLANNELILLMLPSLFILIFRKLTVKKLIIALPFFLLGLAPYIYVPIAASHNPPINWDNASNVPNFIRLVTRADYGWGGATWTSYHVKLDTRIISFGRYFHYWLTNLPPLLFISFLGVVELFRKKKYLLLAALLVAYLLNGPLLNFYYAASEATPFTFGTFERYYAISGIFLLLLFPFGISCLSELISYLMNKRIAPLTIQCIFLIVTVVLFSINFPRTDLHNIWIGETFIADVFSPLPRNSVLLTDWNDIFVFNSRYMRYVKGFRKDSTIEIINSSSSFKRAIKKYTDHPIFVTSNVIDQQGSDAPKTIPYGLVLKIVTDKDPILSKDEYNKKQGQLLAKLSEDLIPAEKISRFQLIALLPAYYAFAYIDTARYFMDHYKDRKIARHYLLNAITIYPNNLIPYMGLVTSYFQDGDCMNAMKYLNDIFE